MEGMDSVVGAAARVTRKRGRAMRHFFGSDMRFELW